MRTLEKLTLLPVVLNLFDAAEPDPNTQTTGSSDLSPEMKTYYDKELIELTEAELIHDQFGQQKDIPAGSGKTIEFRQFDPLPELTAPLTEGVTPDGQSMKVKSLTATVSQYGGYVTVSDMLDMTAIDPMILEATKLISSQAGRTLDTITREVINGGTVVQYAHNNNGGVLTEITSRANLNYTSPSNNCNLTVDDIKRGVRTLKNQDAKEIDGSFVGIIHPDVAYDLMRDPEWLAPKEYVDTDGIYNGEIGKLYGVRFVENTRAKKWEAAGKDGADVYSTLIIAADAYGVTKLANGGLEHIVKQRGSAGTADPLNQRATVGWKATKTAEILVQQYMVRIESTATP